MVDPGSQFERASGRKHVCIGPVPEDECRSIVRGREAEVCDY